MKRFISLSVRSSKTYLNKSSMIVNGCSKINFTTATSNTTNTPFNNNNSNNGNKTLFNDERFYHEDKYHGISKEPFSKEIVDVLLADLQSSDIEIKPDGLIYLPEIKYRRILNQAFGPGGWALKPFGPPVVENKTLIRPYALYCLGRYVAESIGEQAYNENNPFISFATATESAKSNALVRCCKDLGIGSSLWDPIFIRQWKAENATEKWFENQKTKERRPFWVLSNGQPNQIPYPWKESDYSQVPQSSSSSSQTIQQPQQETIAYHQDEPQHQHQQHYRPAQTQTTTSSSSPAAQSTTEQNDDLEDIDIDDVVPPQLKKYAGKTWRQLVADPKGLNYLQWAASSFDNVPKIKNQAIAILEFINKSDLNQ